MPGKRVQRGPGRIERGVGWIILLALGGIAAAICAAQFRHNPAVTAAAAAEAAAGRLGPTQGPDAALPCPPGFVAQGPVESFDAGSLADKIDGKAELYLDAGFSRLRCQRLGPAGAARWLEIFLYDMKNADAAFAVYSIQRRADAQPVSFTRDGYGTPNAVFFLSGRCYVEVVASAADMGSELEKVTAQVLASFGAPTDARVAEQDYFPPEGLQADTVTLLADDAFGYQDFDRIFTAEIALAGQRGLLFVSPRATPGEARKLAEGFASFIMENGGEATDQPEVLSLYGAFERVFSVGPVLGGVHAAASAKWAKLAGDKLAERIAAVEKKNAGAP